MAANFLTGLQPVGTAVWNADRARRDSILKRNVKADAKMDAKYIRMQRPSSDNSGEIYYASTDETDNKAYSRNSNAVFTPDPMGISAAINAQQPSPIPVSSQRRRGVQYTETTGFVDGRAPQGVRVPEQAKRATGPGSTRGTRKKSTRRSDRKNILTGSAGLKLGNASTSKPILGG